MQGYDIVIRPAMIGQKTATAILRSEGQIVAQVIIREGVGAQEGKLTARCDCTIALQPCIHILALRTVQGLTTIEAIHT
jgi:hypothetical protein